MQNGGLLTSRQLKALLFFALAGAGTLVQGDETVTVRSGSGQIGSQDNQVRFLAYGVTTDVTPKPADFTAVQTGPFAYVVAPYPTYIPSLPSDPAAGWISTTPSLSQGSALYAIPFQLTDQIIASATLDFRYAVDNAVNCLYINGTRISGNCLDGDYHGQYELVRNDIAPLLLPNSTNWLYVNVSDYGQLSAVIFSALITTQGGAPQTILPSSGGNAGDVSVKILGQGFTGVPTTAILREAGQPDIVGISPVVVNSNEIDTTFHLLGATTGARDVLVTQGVTTVLSLPGAFTVEQGGAPNIRIQKIGSPVVLGDPSDYFISVENSGKVDATNVQVIEIIDPAQFSIISVNPSAVVDVDKVKQASTMYWTIPQLGAGQTTVLTYRVQVRPTVALGSTVSGNVCWGPGVFTQYLQCAARAAFVAGQCALCAAACTSAVAGCTTTGPLSPACWFPAYGCFTCLFKIGPFGPAGCLTGIVTTYQCVAGLFQCTSTQKTVRGSKDPNDLIGISGVGDQHWIGGNESVPYSILFENLPTANKPATNIDISDIFDATKFDLTTLTMGPISFGTSVYTPPAVPLSAIPVSADVDLRPSQDLIVRIKAAVDVSTGTLKVNFISIDPTTGLPPTNPLIGFLPPGANGSVFFKVTPKPGLETGTLLQDQATVVFDKNPAINTPTWLNTIDNTPPTSHVSSLPPIENSVSFPVTWSGTDVGAGVQDFTIFASDNGGTFAVWLQNVTGTSATFTGQLGHTYAFYSIARDLVGNVESGKTSAEATTRVGIDTTPPVITPNISGTLGANGWYTSVVTVTWSVADPESGISSSTGCSPTNLPNDTAGTVLTCSATNGAGLSNSVSVTIKIDQTPPVISGLPAPGCVLWPPNHQLVQVATVTASDAGSGMASFNVSGTSSESDPDIAQDIVITGFGLQPRTVQLEAERSGTGNGRVYTLTAVAADQAGNHTTGTATCTVPHNQ